MIVLNICRRSVRLNKTWLFHGMFIPFSFSLVEFLGTQAFSLLGSLGGAAVWRLPLAQGAILETRDRVPHRAPRAWSLLLPLPVSLPRSLSVAIINK